MNRRLRTRSAAGAVLMVIGALASAAPGRAAQPQTMDFQRANRAVAAVPAQVAAARRSERAKLGRLGLLQVAARSGAVRAYGRLDALLTAASKRPARDIALDYVRAHDDVFGLDAGDLSALTIARQYSAGGIEHVRWAQSYAHIPAIDTSLTANLTGDGRLINVLGEPRPDLKLASVTPQVPASEAYATAARALGGRASAPQRAASGPQRATDFAGGGEAKLVIYEGGGPRLGWRLKVPVDSTHVYDAVVDATTGVLQRSRNIVRSASALIYRNYPGASAGGSQETVAFDAFLDSPTPSRLSGPFAHTFTDADDDVRGPGDAPPPSGAVPPAGGNWNFAFVDHCSPSLCTWNPFLANSWSVNREADATQLHWFVSTFHDHLASTPAIAFTTAAGNFEGGDRVLAQSLDGASTDAGLPDDDHVDNANMATYPDGTSPHMQMYLTTMPGHAASTGFDAAIVYHEYTHGLVGRSIVDASGQEATTGAQAGAFNEGTADFYALDYLVAQGLETDDPALRDVVLGRFAFPGLRSEPSDCAVPADPSALDAVCSGGATAHYGGYTYADFGSVHPGGAEVHADGEIWTQTLWQLRQAIGVDHTRRVLTNAMRIAPDNPSFLDLRNAVLQAAVVSHPADVDAVWATFADRGMGYFASTTGTSDAHPIANRSLPPAAGAPTATVSGTVTDFFGGAPLAGVKVAFTGHDSGLGPELSATTNASGAYAIGGVPAGTYPLLRARGGAYTGQAANVVVAPEGTTRNFALRRNVAATAAGARIASFTGPDYSGFGCGPSGLIDQDGGLVWGSAADPAPQVVVELAVATDLAAIEIDPAAGCGDDANASLGQYELQASANGITYTTIASGTFTAADNGRDNPVAFSTPPPAGTRYVKLVAKSPQSSAGSGADFVDVAELRAFGPATPAPAPPPAPAPAPAPPPPPAVPARDTMPPRGSLSGLTTQRIGSSVAIGVTCLSEPCRARASATVRVPRVGRVKAKTYKLGPRTRSGIAAGRKVTLALSIPAKARTAIRRALRARKRASAKVTVVVTDAAGNAATLTRTIRFRR